MRRLFYVALGATVGVLVVRRVTETAQRFTPQGIAVQAGSVGERVGAWWSQVQDAAAVREAELRQGLGIAGGGSEQPGDDTRQPAA